MGTAKKEGGRFLLDGRKIKVKNYENGNFIGPAFVDNLHEEMTAYKEEGERFLDQFSIFFIKTLWNKLLNLLTSMF